MVAPVKTRWRQAENGSWHAFERDHQRNGYHSLCHRFSLSRPGKGICAPPDHLRCERCDEIDRGQNGDRAPVSDDWRDGGWRKRRSTPRPYGLPSCLVCPLPRARGRAFCARHGALLHRMQCVVTDTGVRCGRIAEPHQPFCRDHRGGFSRALNHELLAAGLRPGNQDDVYFLLRYVPGKGP